MGALVSAALIVRDEAAVLAECLASVRGIADEIIVLDTGSIDDTPAIAAAGGAKVYHRKWDNDFSAARNAVLDQCTGEWILYIDADERLAPTPRPVIEDLLRDASEVAFRLRLRPSVGATPYLEYRLWRNDPRIRFAGAIHEKVVPSIHAVAESENRPIGICDLLLEHVGYEGDQTRKHRRNLPLLRHQLAVEPDNLFNWHHLARVHAGLGDTRESERTLAHAVEVARNKPFLDAVGVLAFADLIEARHNRGADVTALLAEARHMYPTNWVLRWQQARILITQQRFAEALEHLDELAAVDTATLPDDGPSYDQRLFGELAHDARGLCMIRSGDHSGAAEAYADAAKAAPENPAYRVKQQLAQARALRANTPTTTVTNPPESTRTERSGVPNSPAPDHQ